ncbi:serine hydrolase [Thalassobacillus sp. CUG 92003]|uniref:serine hydrolase domain-containing protein n=1 Tax=Thalassobacillus sp. CUG 92003 TaxID=2736641 RepID=UPI0015E75E02|nr:serine hydrolase domain-containing protein [Thalassobacillus sp. CUG 92003]
MAFEQFENEIDAIMRDKQIPGIAVGVSRHGQPLYTKGFGYRDIERELPVDDQTIFGTASITKSLTASVVLRLEAEGKLRLDDAVVHHVPELRSVVPSTLKLFHLLSHTSGLAPIERKESLTRLDKHIEHVKRVEKTWLGEPGDYFSYSNDMFLLAGLIIERVTGQSFYAYVTETVIAPLNMSRSSFNLDTVRRFDNVSTPYEIEEGRVKACDWPSLGNYAVGGGLRSNVRDMLTYSHALLANHEKLALPRIRLLQGQAYGHGVNVQAYQDRYTLIEHSGGQPGVSSHFGMIPEVGLTAVVLVNRSGIHAASIWLKLVNEALGLPIEEQRFTYQPIPLAPSDLVCYTGCYTAGEGEHITIETEHHHLRAITAEESYPLYPVGGDEFVDGEAYIPIKFHRRSHERHPWGVLFGSRVLLKNDT